MEKNFNLAHFLATVLPIDAVRSIIDKLDKKSIESEKYQENSVEPTPSTYYARSIENRSIRQEKTYFVDKITYPVNEFKTPKRQRKTESDMEKIDSKVDNVSNANKPVLDKFDLLIDPVYKDYADVFSSKKLKKKLTPEDFRLSFTSNKNLHDTIQFYKKIKDENSEFLDLKIKYILNPPVSLQIFFDTLSKIEN